MLVTHQQILCKVLKVQINNRIKTYFIKEKKQTNCDMHCNPNLQRFAILAFQNIFDQKETIPKQMMYEFDNLLDLNNHFIKDPSTVDGLNHGICLLFKWVSKHDDDTVNTEKMVHSYRTNNQIPYVIMDMIMDYILYGQQDDVNYFINWDYIEKMSGDNCDKCGNKLTFVKWSHEGSSDKKIKMHIDYGFLMENIKSSHIVQQPQSISSINQTHLDLLTSSMTVDEDSLIASETSNNNKQKKAKKKGKNKERKKKRCPYCSKSYSSYSILDHHLNDKHKDKYEMEQENDTENETENDTSDSPWLPE